MSDKEALRKEKIEDNRRYLVHANSVLADARRLLESVDRSGSRLESVNQGVRPSNELLVGHSPLNGKRRLGAYKNHLNGKGWRKLRI